SCFKYTKGWSTIAAGNYKFTMDCKITSGVPCIQVGADETGAALSQQSNYTESYDSVNYKYTITFTMTSDFNGNLGAMIGNYGTGNRNGTTGDAVFACANPELYLLDGSGNPTGSNLINTFNSSYYSTSRAGNKWNRRNSAGWTCGSIPSGYFNPIVPEYVHFEPNRNGYSRFNYCFKNGALKAGDYRFQMDCKIFSGTPRITVGDRDGGNTFNPFSTQTNYNASYDATNYKYTVTFTLTADLGSSDYMCILVGNYGNDGDFVCANPTFYKMSGGEPTGSNLINTFASKFYSSSMEVEKWERRGNYTCTTLPDNYFDKESTGNYALHFPQVSDSYQVVVYKDNGIYVAANSVYRLVMDVNNLTEAEPTIQMRTGSDIGVSYTGTLISTDGYERVYEFTVTSAATGIGLFMGPYSNGSNIDVAFRKPRLYKWVNGAYGGANMLAPLSAANFDRHNWTGTRANALNGKWTPLNCNGTLLEYDVDNGSNFVEVKEEMVHFPIGYDNCHVLAYKGGEIAAGTYRFTVDEYAVGGVTSYVNLFVNSGYTTTVTKGTDTLSNNKRTVEFTLYNAKDSFLLMIGNYGNGDNMDTYYANAKLYKVEGGSTVGNNLISTFKNTNVVFTTSGSRTNAATNKWTTINWAKGYIIFDEYNPEPRMLKLGGFGDSMNAMSYELALTPGETYQFDMDYRANGGVAARKAVSAAVSSTELDSLNDANTISRTDT
ncbi:MAG: hypothetical protein J6T73_05910, partial [Clostridia bacterium]|nr:hypothetical protein [Clostridia bacterium]